MGPILLPAGPCRHIRTVACAIGGARLGSRLGSAYPGGHDRVFVTHEDATVRVALGDLRYARVTPGVQAGTVQVRREPDGDGTRAEVTCDLVALGPDADLAAFRAGFPAMMEAWEASIAAAL